MDFFKVLLSAIGSVIALFLMTKIIGNKQMNQLNLFDYINGITIGSIGAELAVTTEKDFYIPLTALFVYTIATFLINLISSKSIAMRRFFEGKTLILMNNGRLCKENFKKANLDLNEFLTQGRIMGYYDLSDINSAFIESNGKISFLPNDDARPLTPKDMGLNPQQSKIMFNVIIDGKLMEGNLKHTGFDRIWLEKQISLKKLALKDIYLGLCSVNGKTVFYEYSYENKSDPFQ